MSIIGVPNLKEIATLEGYLFGKFGEFYQIAKLYSPNILPFNYYCQYCNVFTKLIFYTFSPNFSPAKLLSYTVCEENQAIFRNKYLEKCWSDFLQFWYVK